MRAVVQRVSRAVVRAEEAGVLVEVGRTGPGVLVLVCALAGDGVDDALRLAERVARYRIFADDVGRTNRSLLDVGGGALVVSQFTLSADGRKGRRPSFDRAAAPELARELYARFHEHLASLGVTVATGRFGAHMEVELVNDGPATYLLDEPKGS